MRGIAVEQGKFHWRRASREPGVGSRSREWEKLCARGARARSSLRRAGNAEGPGESSPWSRSGTGTPIYRPAIPRGRSGNVGDSAACMRARFSCLCVRDYSPSVWLSARLLSERRKPGDRAIKYRTTETMRA